MWPSPRASSLRSHFAEGRRPEARGQREEIPRLRRPSLSQSGETGVRGTGEEPRTLLGVAWDRHHQRAKPPGIVADAISPRYDARADKLAIAALVENREVNRRIRCDPVKNPLHASLGGWRHHEATVAAGLGIASAFLARADNLSHHNEVETGRKKLRETFWLRG